jgi:deoxyribonuclease V
MSEAPSPAAWITCLDVDYRPASVVAAAVSFLRWTDAAAAHEVVHTAAEPPAEYEPGQFYRRELPHLLAVLGLLPAPPRLILVDGFVWLADQPDGTAGPGLGAHLHAALAAASRAPGAPGVPGAPGGLGGLGGPIPVVGVAKRPYRLANRAVPVLRGESQLPLWVTAVGLPLDEAVAAVAAMHGEHRIPTLLRRVDRLARDS